MKLSTDIFHWDGVIYNEDGFVRSNFLFHEGLGGSIQTEVGMLSNLEKLSLDYNKITGSTPSKVAYCAEYIWLHLVLSGGWKFW